MKRWLLGLCCVLLSGAALAAGPKSVRKRVQLSMLVTGNITVTPQGTVSGYTIDHPEQLPEAVRELVDKFVPRWTFEPVLVGGQPAIAKSSMNLRIVAKPAGDDKYTIGIAGSHFGGPASWRDPSGRTISSIKHHSPEYPMDAARARVSGTVYVVLQVNRDGLVDKDAAEQVNLDVVGSEAEMRHWRTVLAKAALNAARRWTFAPPTSGAEAAQSLWVVRVPVKFLLSGWNRPVEKYGSWHAYVPGPRNSPVWMHERSFNGSADALAAGDVVEVGKGLHLLTPLNGS